MENDGGAISRRISWRSCSSGEFARRSRVSERLAATSNSAARFSCGRTKRRKSEIDLLSRSDSFSTIDISRCSCGVSDFEFLSTCTEPAIAASGLRISWAMPAESSPTAAMLSLRRSSASSFFISVRSWKISV